MPVLLGKDDLVAMFDAFIHAFRFDPSFTKLWTAANTAPIGPGAHFHRHWEIRLILRGRLDWPDGPEHHHPACLIIPPRKIHRSLAIPAQDQTSVTLVLTSSGRWVFQDAGARRTPGLARTAIEQRLGAALPDTFEALARDHRPITASHADLAEDRRRFWDSRLRSVWLAFLLAMKETHATEKGHENLVERALHHIDTAYYRPDLTVEHIAAACGCSATHLAHVFRRELNRSVRQSLIQKRLERSMEILREGGYLVKEVAYLTGWRSAYHFSNSFAKHFGQRPADIEPEPAERADAVILPPTTDDATRNTASPGPAR